MKRIATIVAFAIAAVSLFMWFRIHRNWGRFLDQYVQLSIPIEQLEKAKVVALRDLATRTNEFGERTPQMTNICLILHSYRDPHPQSVYLRFLGAGQIAMYKYGVLSNTVEFAYPGSYVK